MLSGKGWKKPLSGLLASAIIALTAIAGHCYASTTTEQITVTFNDTRLAVNGRQIALQDASGNTVEPFNYQGTVYAPIRSIALALKLNLSYDSSTNTVALTSTQTGASNSSQNSVSKPTGTTPSGTPPTGQSGSGGTPPTPPDGEPPSGNPPGPPPSDGSDNTGTPPSGGTPPTGTPPSGTPPTGTPPSGDSNSQGSNSGAGSPGHQAYTETITATCSGTQVTVNGKTISITDANGNAVQPINYSNSIYVPIRSIASALNLSISYDSTTNTVSLTGAGGAGGQDVSSGSGGSGGTPGGSGGSTAQTSGSAVYSQSGSTVTKFGETINATQSDQSCVMVNNSGILTLSGSTLNKTGDTSSEDESNFYGLNAAVLAKSGSSITLNDSSITTNSEGSNAVFATGESSHIYVSDVTINTSSNSSRGLDATLKGSITATNVNITTAGAHCAALATDRGNGTVTVTGGTMNTAGEGSPGIYSTGTITATDATFTAVGSEAAVIEGKNAITVNNCSLVGTVKHGVMLYQSFSGDAEVGTSVFTMNGGTLTAKAGPLFYSTNTKAIINLNGAALNGSSGILLKAAADRWGSSGSNGAEVTLNADSQNLAGSVICDSISKINIVLKNGSVLEATINAENTAKLISLSLDQGSTWIVVGNSYLSSFTDSVSDLSNIDDNGYTIYYDSSNSANNWLEGKTYTLKDGGQLSPKN
ncbi:MAG: stalk domain-containing protein [Syntrophomonas sp.]